MRDELLLYYERELTFLRRMGADFSERYPKIASRLLMEPDKCEDPHVERLLEAFAFLAARVHLKIDDEFPEITEALLSILYPHYIRPIPSMSVVEYIIDPEQGKVDTGLKVPRNTMLYSRPVGGTPCKFRSCYDTVLWPVNVVNAEWRTPDRLQPAVKSTDAVGAIRLELETSTDAMFPAMKMDSLRFFLSGDSSTVNTLYELLNCNLVQILVRDPNPGTRVRPFVLPPTAFRPVGFEEDEGMLPYPHRSFIGYRLLQEYFAFPEKFHFFEITGLAEAWMRGFKKRAEIIFLISEFEISDRKQTLETGVAKRTFRLGCSPIVNLFPQTAEPILLDQRKYEYPIVPDLRRMNATEIFSVDEVVSVDPQTHETLHFEPFYSYRHSNVRDRLQTFWLASRRASGRNNDEGTDVYLSMVDLSGRPIRPETDALTMRTTCTNRDLPGRLPFGTEAGDFEVEGLGGIRKIIALAKPTPSYRPPIGKSSFWRLISHLSLNYLSLVDEGKDAFQEILRLYDYINSAFSEKQVNGITRLESARIFARVFTENGISFARGARVELSFDEEQFTGSGVFLFAAVIERFLGLYVTLNSFTQLIARTQQRKEPLKQWPPRAGRRILI
jgi:type VI secretion system protein ImpG